MSMTTMASRSRRSRPSSVNWPSSLFTLWRVQPTIAARSPWVRFVRSRIAEVSIKGAVHEDAQFPMSSGLAGLMSDATEDLQITFVSALTATAFSLSTTGRFDYAWTSFRDGIENGKLIGAKRK